ncbi:MAG: hypothetical protein ABIR46_03485 [Candidatus Saccharimonadales bacterium]
MGFVKAPTTLGEFWSSPKQPGAELLKLTFEDGSTLFLSEGKLSRMYYPVHPDFVPTQLQTAIEKYRFDPRDEAFVRSARIGMSVDIIIGDKNGSEGHCHTASKLASIEICDYRDAFHDDLNITR